LIVLLAIESSDIIFATDSIPAIFAITPDPFIVYTSNIFAMLGLRALYFAVAGFMRMFHLLRYGFASIITILGAKMLLSDFYKLPLEASLILIVFILMICVIASLLRPRKADLKPMFERTERLGLLPFRRLLLIENILDLGDAGNALLAVSALGRRRRAAAGDHPRQGLRAPRRQPADDAGPTAATCSAVPRGERGIAVGGGADAVPATL
jgi:hypothetical protein